MIYSVYFPNAHFPVVIGFGSGSLTDFSKTNKKILDVRANELLGPQGMYLNVEIETNKGIFSSSFGGSGKSHIIEVGKV